MSVENQEVGESETLLFVYVYAPTLFYLYDQKFHKLHSKNLQEKRKYMILNTINLLERFVFNLFLR